MTKLAIYILNLALRCHHDQIMERAASLTYRVLLAFFPFLIFLISFLGMIDIDESAIMSGLFFVLPSDIAELVQGFVQELSENHSTGVMSTALFFSVYNTSNGFRAIVRITNRAYGVDDRRGFVVQVLLSIALMLLFATTIIIMLGILVFGRQIWGLFFPLYSEVLFTLASGGGAIIILTLVVLLIFRIATATQVRIVHILPGAIFTVVSWVIVSAFFGFAISTFTQYSAIYGSIAGVFILMLWLNIICTLLLVGNEANAVVREYL